MPPLIMLIFDFFARGAPFGPLSAGNWTGSGVRHAFCMPFYSFQTKKLEQPKAALMNE
ncbi:hypothetical protein [Bacillus stratosphericus]|uniref:hypothetical protein n=1 Tax=Bacillus stratosphericus TaxID=293386 RepID=UPI001CFB61C6|nr:hypothetical protein [Bacillus stratosphericus]